MAIQQAFLLALMFSCLGLWCVNGNEYEFFQMVQQWGQAKCSGKGEKCHVTPKPMFTIHGLWPSNFTDLLIGYCSTQAFDVTKVDTLLPELSKYWSDIVKGKDVVFWEHEWEKHGTCSNPPFDIFEYFELALNIRKHENYDLLAILNNAGLNPTSKIYNYADIESAIQAAVGKKPWLKCNTNSGRAKNDQLWEIVLCLDHDGVNPIDCPSKPRPKNICPKQIIWHPRQSLASVVEGEESLGYRSNVMQQLITYLS